MKKVYIITSKIGAGKNAHEVYWGANGWLESITNVKRYSSEKEAEEFIFDKFINYPTQYVRIVPTYVNEAFEKSVG